MDTQYTYINTESSLESLVERLRKARRIAIDIEADSFHHYYEKVCLIQLAVGQSVSLVDPLAGLDLSALLEVLSEKLLVFHDGGYDLRMLRSSFGFRPGGGIFDTMLAAQLVGIREFGLAPILERFFDIKVAKTHQKANWSRRPLDERLLDYASVDVVHLERLADVFRAELKELGRDGWHEESCRWMVESAMAEKAEPDADRQWRIKGTRQLDRRQLALVRELWHWRDQEARQADHPPFKVLGNHQLLELALWAHDNPGKPLCHGPKLPRNCINRRLKALQQAIEKAMQLPESGCPNILVPKRSRGPNSDCKNLVEVLKTESQQIADRLGIEAFLLAPRATIAAVAQRRPETVDELVKCGPMMKWQAELLWPVVSRRLL